MGLAYCLEGGAKRGGLLHHPGGIRVSLIGAYITHRYSSISSQPEVFLEASHLALATFNMGSGCLCL